MVLHYGVTLSMIFGLTLTLKSVILGIISKFNVSTKKLNSLTYPVYLNIKLLSLLFLFILRIRKHLLFVLNTMKLFVNSNNKL